MKLQLLLLTLSAAIASASPLHGESLERRSPVPNHSRSRVENCWEVLRKHKAESFCSAYLRLPKYKSTTTRTIKATETKRRTSTFKTTLTKTKTIKIGKTWTTTYTTLVKTSTSVLPTETETTSTTNVETTTTTPIQTITHTETTTETFTTPPAVIVHPSKRSVPLEKRHRNPDYLRDYIDREISSACQSLLRGHPTKVLAVTRLSKTITTSTKTTSKTYKKDKVVIKPSKTITSVKTRTTKTTTTTTPLTTVIVTTVTTEIATAPTSTTKTTTTTSTSTTVVAGCAPTDLLQVQGFLGVYVNPGGGTIIFADFSQQESAYDCCALCMNMAECGGVSYYPSNGRCGAMVPYRTGSSFVRLFECPASGLSLEVVPSETSFSFVAKGRCLSDDAPLHGAFNVVAPPPP